MNTGLRLRTLFHALAATGILSAALDGCNPPDMPAVPVSLPSTALMVAPDTIVHSGTASVSSTEATTTIRFEVPAAGRVRLAIYAADGDLLTVLVDEELEPGLYEVQFDANGLSSGAYAVALDIQGSRRASKLLLIK